MSKTLNLLNTIERQDSADTKGWGKYSKIVNSGFVFDRPVIQESLAMRVPRGDRFLSMATVLLMAAGIGLFIFITSYYTSKIRYAVSKTEDVASKLKRVEGAAITTTNEMKSIRGVIGDLTSKIEKIEGENRDQRKTVDELVESQKTLAYRLNSSRSF